MNAPKYQRSSHAIFAEVANDIVALHVERGKCYGMENVTAAIWAMLAEPLDLDQLCATLVERYDVEPERCRFETGQVIDQLINEGLVEAA